ncbi:MAG: 50S ribosomal protein L20 [Firmicutes bacterium]|uniref:Large ribosomal subunit protein bL20 n=1 Tax=Candidatus Scatoplasma merdavium TaxID=2840932 RepID=A0A9D9DA68_9BACL|nr:50S ribosomal protein L20 [Candidatus Scatoplasma merdavium]
MRVKGGNKHAYRKKVLKFTKGFFGSKHTLYRTANEAMIKALAYSYVGRRLRKRDFRKLWIVRINAACRNNDISYSRFMNGLKLANINLNRKVLSEIAINDPKAFTDLVETSKKALAK